MVFTVNWQHLARFAPKLAIGLGASAGMGYFINRTYCDSPSAIGTIETDDFNARMAHINTNIHFDKDLDGFTFMASDAIPFYNGDFFKNTSPTVIRGVYLHTETLKQMLTGRDDGEDTGFVTLSYADLSYIPMKVVIKSNKDIDVSNILIDLWKASTVVLVNSLNFIERQTIEGQTIEKAFNDLQEFYLSIPIEAKLKTGERFVITKEADESITVEFPNSSNLSGFNVKNMQLSRMMLMPLLNASFVTFKAIKEPQSNTILLHSNQLEIKPIAAS